MKCTECVYYKICKNLIKAGFTGVNETFPEAGGCEVFNPKHEEKVKEGEKKCNQQYQPLYKLSLQIEDTRCLN
nr:MAG TPA: hypothetical protein [Caudoviricetes sp.]